MLNPLATDFLRAKFESALPYDAYVATGKPNEQENWSRFHARVAVTADQRDLISGFIRKINVLCVSGTWCGDCVQQCPFLDHIRAANPARIDVRFLDRDLNRDISDSLTICGGHRVPVAIFMNEDCEFVSLFGDRSLSRYRALAERNLGPSCPLPGSSAHGPDIAHELQAWVDEFERVHLLLRLSNKLRQRHMD